VLGRAGGRRREGKEKKKGGKERRKRKGIKEKERKEKKREERGGKIRKEKKENREGFSENLGKFLGRLGKVLRGFSRFSGVGAFFRDGGDSEADRASGPRHARDSRPVADRGVGKARMGAGRGAVPAGFATRAPGGERGKQWLGFEW
jgi:hypothetical protein